eukprot:GFKZ01015705.1.p1 GENE.GFKZ01015705.1~~GFKZ01015705.1.p1  ORF type:complete len:1234 (-),score=182.58 GFKZ01015705.1:566-4000(-)
MNEPHLASPPKDTPTPAPSSSHPLSQLPDLPDPQDPLISRISLGLPTALQTLTSLRSSNANLTDVEALHVWELDFALFAHASSLSETISHQSFYLGRTSSDPPHQAAQLLDRRTALLQSLRVLQNHVRAALSARVNLMHFKPRLYRLADHLNLTEGEIRAFMFIVLSCAGIEVPGAEDRRQGIRAKAELFNCREFSGLEGHQLLDFLSPSRVHFSQGLLEVEDEFATSYPDSKFRAPREVLKAIYGGSLTLDEAMTLGNSALSDVLAEEADSVLNGHLGVMPSTKPEQVTGIADVAVEKAFQHVPNARERTTDGTEMLDLLSDLHAENNDRVIRTQGRANPALAPASAADHAGVEMEGDESNNGYIQNGDNAGSIDDEPPPDADVLPYEDDMQYLKDGFEVVREACKVYNFREKNSEEDRYTSTKRPVEALQREADAKLRKATMHFTRRLNKTTKSDGFMPRLELLVSKLKLVHFERMVILTLVGSVLSQSVRKTLRSDPSSAYETGITVAKLLRVHCGGDLRDEIKSRSYFYRNATLIRSGIVTIDVPYNMPFSDLGDFCCELDHMVLDYVAGLQTELDEIMDSARCYSPKVDMESVILPKKMKDLVLQRTEHFEIFRRLRKEVGFDDIVRYGKGLTLFFHGKSGTGKTLFANALASHLKKKLLVVDFASLNNSKHSNAEAYRIVFREAKVHGAIVFMDECDELFESRDRGGKGAVTLALREMETFDGLMILATNRPQMLDEAMHRRIALSLEFEAPDANLRLAIWEKHIPKNLKLAEDVDLKALSIEFELTGGYIKNAVFQALAQAVSRVQGERRSQNVDEERNPLQASDVVITLTELRQACRLQARGDLKRAKLERRVLPASGLDKLVATEESMKTLRDVVMVEKVRGLMTTRWGFKDRQARCNCVLILGPSGCGKTFAAGCLGFETGRPLQRLAASELHGSREGTSEIASVFNQAAVAGAVVVVEHAEQLLFETASPESSASPSLELLFHLQSFDGLVVLCCTTASSSSEAGWPLHVPIPNRVSSLLSYIVVLAPPSKDARLRLWRQLIPKDTPVSSEVSQKLETISAKYDFTGARISSCIRRGAAAAAMRRNRAALVDSGADESVEKLSISDLESACEAELKLAADSDGTAAWVRGLYV